MARSKQYNEQEVIEKATALFWEKGYEGTSVRMLEKEMGINQFSIYASFGNKRGLFLECIQCYKKRLKGIISTLEASKDGLGGIKQYFYDFVAFSKENGIKKGCLVSNTVNELGPDSDAQLMQELMKFSGEIHTLFRDKLKQDPTKDMETIERQGHYLLGSMLGLSLVSKVFTQKQIADYIETIFSNL
ncbi:TetR/AcrR family transcriptional regulator [Dyadobacter jejuensis]|nr:TetR/AcrR family transcriptional regulator [Dyadobacter jejuensis]